MDSNGNNMMQIGKKKAADGSVVKRFGLEHIGRIVQISNPKFHLMVVQLL